MKKSQSLIDGKKTQDDASVLVCNFSSPTAFSVHFLTTNHQVEGNAFPILIGGVKRLASFTPLSTPRLTFKSTTDR